MPEKYIKRFQFDIRTAEEISSHGDISFPLAELLAGRGVKNYDDACKFLNPSAQDMCSPFSLFGMSAAADRVRRAIDNDERILIYGDYDCDGLSAIAILYCFLRNKISHIDYYVPNRHAEGYGLHNIVIEDLTETKKFDLIITVDCGVTSKDEVEYIKSKGIDVVVTDHHEPVDGLIPDCIVLNPKLDRSVFCDYCGAGVVLKLVEALAGRDVALKYVGYAAIGTIADIVPLVGENRIIAKLGLDSINSTSTHQTKVLLSRLNNKKITANDVMFRIAPRINALGRLKDATPIIELFTGKDKKSLEKFADILEETNKERQELCEEVVKSILKKLTGYDFINNRIIVLCDDNWNIGILGIAASKISEMFMRPVVLFTSDEDGMLRGSARTYGNIDLFDCLSQCKDLYVSFGGHRAAAGLTINPSSISEFHKRVNDYLLNKYDDSYFLHDIYYDLPFDKSIDYDCIESLDKLEPCGFCNPAPLFYLENVSLNFSEIGMTDHIKTIYNGVELVGFNYIKFSESANSGISLVFNLQNKEFRERKYSQGVIKHITLLSPKNLSEDFNAVSYLRYKLELPRRELYHPVKYCSYDDINLNNGLFGNLYVAFSVKTFYNFIDRINAEKARMLRNIKITETVNPYNRVILSPSLSSFHFEYYKNIYFLDTPVTMDFISNLQGFTKADIYIVGDGNEEFCRSLVRKYRCQTAEEYRETYSLLKRTAVFGTKNIEKLHKKIYAMRDSVSPFKILTTMYVMFELGLIEQNDKEGFVFVQGLHTHLEKSIIYNYIESF